MTHAPTSLSMVSPIVAATLLAVTTRTAHSEELLPLAPLAFDAFDRDRDAPANEESNYRSDGVYGRFDGEISLIPFVGVQTTNAGWMTQFGIAAYYFSTVGVTFRNAEGRWSPWSPRADFNVSTLSLSARPLFLLRWSQDLEKGPSFLDLTLDSLTLSVGGYWSSQHSTTREHYGFESELSVGFPLLAKAHGPWLTLSLANRLPRVTIRDTTLDMIYGLRFEWSFSLGN